MEEKSRTDDNEINTNKKNEIEMLIIDDKDGKNKKGLAQDEIKEEYVHDKDPYLDANILSRFFMYWAYKIIKISQHTKMKKE